MTPDILRNLGFAIICVCITANAGAQTPRNSTESDPVGTMAYVEGEVDVHRNGQTIDWTLVDIGLEIEDYDLVQTGADGTAEVELTSPSTKAMRITVTRNSAFYFDVAQIDGGARTSVEMLGGSIRLKVQKLSGLDAVNVRTPSLVMGVRGTEFSVTTAPDGFPHSRK